MMNALLDSVRYPRESNGCSISTEEKEVLEDEQFSLCCLCGKSFPSIRSLHTHINVVHEDVADAFDFHTISDTHCERPPSPLDPSSTRSLTSDEGSTKSESSSTCSICKKTFPGSASLRVHIESVHHGNRTPQCDVCSKTFSTLSYLRMHIATVHEGVKAYSCTLCEKSYTQKHSLKKHMSSAHPETLYMASPEDTVQSNSSHDRQSCLAGSSESAAYRVRRKLLIDSPLSKDSSLSSSCTQVNTETCSSGEV
ncbi:unnamed protein product [Calicophoron daubneyi]|uniref:C2H2-type domain-containing protein n=1 Tax=Calicophoron daubneyi TaxID=300641 RepID=A0AAV2TB13_CALDB